MYILYIKCNSSTWPVYVYMCACVCEYAMHACMVHCVWCARCIVIGEAMTSTDSKVIAVGIDCKIRMSSIYCRHHVVLDCKHFGLDAWPS